MAQAAAQHAVPLERISFRGSLDAVRQFSQAMAQARSRKKRQQLWTQLLEILAHDQVPLRPGYHIAGFQPEAKPSGNKARL